MKPTELNGHIGRNVKIIFSNVREGYSPEMNALWWDKGEITGKLIANDATKMKLEIEYNNKVYEIDYSPIEHVELEG